MEDPTSMKKVKSFRISKINDYKLSRLKKMWNLSEGKTIAKLIENAYFKNITLPELHDPFEGKSNEEIQDIIRVANTKWIEDNLHKSR